MNLWQERKEWIEGALQAWVEGIEAGESRALTHLRKSLEYSLMGGGKRFRPVFSLLVGECFAVAPKRILPWAATVEMIHTYSLIHDDLPCMDNDDLRRGEPTNHKVFGESTALLAGDALLTEAFGLLASAYREQPDLAVRLVSLLSEAAGLRGMIAGQAIDLESQESGLDLEELIRMHELKTGALIRVCAEGAAAVCGLPAEKQTLCRDFGGWLGFAFQLKDDLLDSAQTIEKGSFPERLGIPATEMRLQEASQRAWACLEKLNLGVGPLADLVQMNLDRTQ